MRQARAGKRRPVINERRSDSFMVDLS